MSFPRRALILVIPLAALASVLFGAPAFAQEAQNIPPPQLNIPIPEVSFAQSVKENESVTVPFIAQYIRGVYTFLIGIVGVVAAVMVMIGGFQYLTAGGDKGRIGAGKRRITNALIGLTLVLGSYAVMYAINPELVRFSSLQLFEIETVTFTDEATGDPIAEDIVGAGASSVRVGSCSDPGFAINDLSKVDLAMNRSTSDHLLRLLTEDGMMRLNEYKSVASRVGIPWQVLATVHYKEASMRWDKSILNGGPLCNNKDGSSCSACSSPTRSNDLICGAQLLVKKAKGTFDLNNLDAIKIAFCGYNGCGGAKRQCPEISAYVSPKFDQAHANFVKSGIDCVPTNCKMGCTADITQKQNGRNPGQGCCTIKIYKPGKAPPGYDPGGSACQQNQASRCKIAETADTATYQYFNGGPRVGDGGKTDIERCGSWLPQERPGALTVLALILDMQRTGKLPSK